VWREAGELQLLTRPYIPLLVGATSETSFAAIAPAGLLQFSTATRDNVVLTRFREPAIAQAMTETGEFAVVAIGTSVELWNTQSGARAATLLADTRLSVPPPLAIARDGSAMVVGACVGATGAASPCGYHLFDRAGAPLGRIAVPPDALSPVTFSDDNAYLLAASPVDDAIYSVASLREVRRRSGANREAGNEILHVHGGVALWANQDGLELVDLRSGRVRRRQAWDADPRRAKRQERRSFAVWGANTLAVLGDTALSLWDVTTGTPKQTIELKADDFGRSQALHVVSETTLFMRTPLETLLLRRTDAGVRVATWRGGQRTPLEERPGGFLAGTAAWGSDPAKCAVTDAEGNEVRKLALEVCTSTPLRAEWRVSLTDSGLALLRGDTPDVWLRWGVAEAISPSRDGQYLTIRDDALGLHSTSSGTTYWLAGDRPPTTISFFPRGGVNPENYVSYEPWHAAAGLLRVHLQSPNRLNSAASAFQDDGTRAWYTDIGAAAQYAPFHVDGRRVVFSTGDGLSLCEVGKSCKLHRDRRGYAAGIAWPWVLVQSNGTAMLWNAELDTLEELPTAECATALALAAADREIHYVCEQRPKPGTARRGAQVATFRLADRRRLALFTLPYDTTYATPVVMTKDLAAFPNPDPVFGLHYTTLKHDGTPHAQVVGEPRGALVLHADGSYQRFGDSQRLLHLLRCKRGDQWLPAARCGTDRERSTSLTPAP
jgi:hypothetical protein